MSKRSQALDLNIIITEPVSLDDLTEATIEEYKKLEEKCDIVISKIKNRKEKNKKQK
jgi:hypothetical protein